MNVTRSSVATGGLYSAVASEFRLVPARRSSYSPRSRSGFVAVTAGRHAGTAPTIAARAGHSVAAAVSLMGLGR